MASVGLLKGNLTAQDYEDAVAQDPRIDALRAKMQCIENKQFTQDYLDPSKRSIANALQIFYQDGTHSEKITVEYPIGRIMSVRMLIGERKIQTQTQENHGTSSVIGVWRTPKNLSTMSTNS